MPLTFLVGFMGSGKTTFGKKLARKLKVGFIDLDEVTIAESGFRKIAGLVEKYGIDFFRALESESLKKLSATDAVISTGGGTPCYFDNMAWMLAKGTVVFLSVDEGVIYSRLKSTNLNERPLLKNLDDEALKTFIHEKLAERLPYYRLAHVSFDPVQKPIDDLVNFLKARQSA